MIQLQEPGPSCPPCRVSLRLVFRPTLEEPEKTSKIAERTNYMEKVHPGHESEGDLTDLSDLLTIFGA